METSEAKGKCCCPCQMMLGVGVVLFGLTFLLRTLGVLSSYAAGIVWPIIVMLAGVQLICRGKCKCCTTT